MENDNDQDQITELILRHKAIEEAEEIIGHARQHADDSPAMTEMKNDLLQLDEQLCEASLKWGEKIGVMMFGEADDIIDNTDEDGH